MLDILQGNNIHSLYFMKYLLTNKKVLCHVFVIYNFFHCSAAFMKLGVKAKASVDIRDIKVYLAAEMPITPGAHLQLTSLKITDIGKLKVHFHGLGPLDWVVESLSSFIGNLIRDWLSKVLQGPLKNIIQQMLDNLPIP